MYFFASRAKKFRHAPHLFHRSNHDKYLCMNISCVLGIHFQAMKEAYFMLRSYKTQLPLIYTYLVAECSRFLSIQTQKVDSSH